MADYIPVIDSSVDPDAPLTSDLMYRLRDNPIAISEGAVNAPKVRSEALNLTTAAGRVTADGVILTVSGIDRVSVFQINCYVSITSTSPGSATVRFRTSSNGGSTWSAYTTFDSTVLTAAGNNSSTRFGFITAPASANTLQVDLTSTSGSTPGASVSVVGIRGIAP